MPESVVGVVLTFVLFMTAIGLPLDINALVVHGLCFSAAILCFLPGQHVGLIKKIFGGLLRRNRRRIPAIGSKEKYLALDCEMVGVGKDGRQSALARVSIVDWDLEVVLDTYVQVMERVTDYRTHVSGIRARHLKGENVMKFRECRERVSQLMKEKIIVGHGLDNDFEALRLILPRNNIRDTSLYRAVQRFHNGKWRARKLREIVQEYLQKDDFQLGEHDSVHDARAVMQVYHILHSKWESEMEATK